VFLSCEFALTGSTKYVNVFSEMKGFFTDKRRKFIAKTIIDGVKLTAVGLVVSEVFGKLTMAIRIAAVIILFTLFWISVAVYPKEE